MKDKKNSIATNINSTQFNTWTKHNIPAGTEASATKASQHRIWDG
jgi:hypothetical protein